MFLNARIHSPVGVFVGTLNTVDSPEEDVIAFRDKLQQAIHNIEYITILNGKIEFTLPGGVLKNSVVEFAIEDFTWVDS